MITNFQASWVGCLLLNLIAKKLFLEKIQNLKMLQRNKTNLQHTMFLTILEMTKEEIN